MNYTRILHLLQCPLCGGHLLETDEALICQENNCNHKYPITNGIARFVSLDSTIDYNQHWSNFAQNPASQVKLEQGRQFVNWLLAGQESFSHRDGAQSTEEAIFLDIGCGDGNHLPFLPAKSIKIALDYSNIVDVVAARYRELDNLFVIQADAQQLPVKSSQVDMVISYSCLNHLPEPKQGMLEVSRVLRKGGNAGIWGYGTNNPLTYHGLNYVRKLYHIIQNTFVRKSLVYAMIPSLLIIKNSSGIRPGKHSLAECAEIISTNLSPKYVHVLYKYTWKELVPSNLEHVGDYDIFCGEKFYKT